MREKCPYSVFFWLRKISLRIQPDRGKMRTRKTPNPGIFHAVADLSVFVNCFHVTFNYYFHSKVVLHYGTFDFGRYLFTASFPR